MPIAYNIWIPVEAVRFNDDGSVSLKMTSDVTTANPRTFVTSDGYRLRKKGKIWTDGDLEFEDHRGHPVDSWGQPLEGSFTGSTNPGKYDPYFIGQINCGQGWRTVIRTKLHHRAESIARDMAAAKGCDWQVWEEQD